MPYKHPHFISCWFFFRLAHGPSPGSNVTSLHHFLEVALPQSKPASKYLYLDVLDQNADSNETITEVLNKLHDEFCVKAKYNHLVVAGDAKTYQHLQSLKLDYGEKLSWLLPFPGDFHILMNYQPILSKIYFDAGLKQLANAGGFKGETLTALQRCSHFKHAHRFFLEVWEAFAVHMADSFRSTCDEVKSLVEELKGHDCSSISMIFEEKKTQVCSVLQKFEKYIEEMGERDENWKFWGEFLLFNGFAYVALFFAVRSGNWVLRMAGLKSMAPLFCAFDRPIYRKLVPQHIADVLLLPSDVLQHLQSGNFSVRLARESWHLVGLDEAHEMLINRDCKRAAIRPTKDLGNHMALYFPFRSKVLRNLDMQLDFSISNRSHDQAPAKGCEKFSINMWSIRCHLEANHLLPEDPGTEMQLLRNTFTGVKASPAQQKDLLRFRILGQSDYEAFVEFKYLKTSSARVTTKQHKLNTFTQVKNTNKRLVNQLQKEKQLVAKCLKSRLLLAGQGGSSMCVKEQYLELPKAIADEDGQPHKGNKSNSTGFYKARLVRSTYIALIMGHS